MQSVPYVAKPILNARDAVASHIRWKITLITAARLREPLSERATHSIEHPEECNVNRWLLSRQTAALHGLPEHTAALGRHLEFHRAMQRIAKLLNSGQHEEAEKLLSGESEFERASVAVANALMVLDRAGRHPAES